MRAEWFKDRLRELRTQAGLSRQDLADKAGMKLNGIRDLEQGINKPSLDTIIALCQALAVTCNDLLQEPGDLPPPAAGRPRKMPQADTEEPAVAPTADKPARKPTADKDAPTGKPGALKGKTTGIRKRKGSNP